jgi:hypothetical protein
MRSSGTIEGEDLGLEIADGGGEVDAGLDPEE